MKRLLLLVLLAAPVMAQAQSPQDLFQEALRLERSQGDLSGAIALYQRVAANFGTDRELGAEALLHMAQAYEQLGETEAERAYRRIVAEFGDQEETVAAAREALGRLVRPASGLTALGIEPELVHEQIGFATATLSPDGSLFVNTNWTTNALGYQRIGEPGVTYVSQRFEEPARNGTSGSSGRFSGDNSRLAFLWWDGDERSHWLHVHDVGTGENAVLFNNERRFDIVPGEGYAYFQVLDWNSAGTEILIQTWNEPVRGTIELIDATTGETRAEAPLHGTAHCLVDDRYVLATEARGEVKRAVRLDLQTQEVSELMPGAADSELVECSGSSAMAIIRASLTGNPEVWGMKLEDGLPSSTPIALTDVLPDARGVGLTPTGEFLYYRQSGGGDSRRLEVYPYSLETWQVNGPGERLVAGTGSVIGWASESGSMAWHSSFFDSPLRIRTPDGTERELDPDGIFQMSPEGWTIAELSPDGSMLFALTDKVQGIGTLRVSTADGSVIDTIRVTQGTPGSSADQMLGERRQDEQTLCFDYHSGVPATTEQLVCFNDTRSTGAWGYVSPDEENLLVYSSGEGGRHYYRVSVDTGEVVRVLEEVNGRNPGWAPDSQNILFVTDDRTWHVADLNGENVRTFLPRLQETRNILQFTWHYKEPFVMMDSVRRPGGEMSELFSIGGLLSRLTQQRQD